MEDVFGDRGRFDDVVVNQRGYVAEVGEQVAAEQGLRDFLVQQPSFPRVRDVRGV